jgi:hypothetical protein
MSFGWWLGVFPLPSLSNILQVIGLLLCIWYPGIVLWLPKVTGLLD